MQATRMMMNELAEVMTNSHLIWGRPEEEEPPPPPGPVPNVWINMTGRADGDGDFGSYATVPPNVQEDLDSVLIYPGAVAIVFANEFADPLNEGSPYLLECVWNEVLLRWEHEFTGS